MNGCLTMPMKPTTPKTATRPGPKRAGPAARRGAGAGPGAKAKAAGAAAGSETLPTESGVAADEVKGPIVLRLKELVERVTASTGGKKKGIKEVVEAALKELGQALELGHSLNLPGFGKARVAKPQGAESGSPMTVKLRRGVAPGGKGKAAKEALAADGDQD